MTTTIGPYPAGSAITLTGATVTLNQDLGVELVRLPGTASGEQFAFVLEGTRREFTVQGRQVCADASALTTFISNLRNLQPAAIGAGATAQLVDTNFGTVNGHLTNISITVSPGEVISASFNFNFLEATT